MKYMENNIVYAPYVPLQTSVWRIVAVIRSNIKIGDVVVRTKGNQRVGSLEEVISSGLCIDCNLDTISVMFDDVGILLFTKSTNPLFCYDSLHTLEDYHRIEK